LLVGEVVRDELGDFQLPSSENGAPPGFGGWCRLWPLPAAQREGHTFVEGHGAAAGESSVIRRAAEPLTGGRFRLLVLGAEQFNQGLGGLVAYPLGGAEQVGSPLMLAEFRTHPGEGFEHDG